MKTTQSNAPVSRKEERIADMHAYRCSCIMQAQRARDNQERTLWTFLAEKTEQLINRYQMQGA